MGYFPRVHCIAARPRSPKVHEQNERPRSIPRMHHPHVDVQRHLMEMNRNAILPFLFMQEDSHQEDGHSSDLDLKQSGILLVIANHKENGTDSQN